MKFTSKLCVYSLGIVVAIASYFSVNGQAVTSQPSVSANTTQMPVFDANAQLVKLNNMPALRGATVSCYFTNISNGTVVVAQNQKTLLTPASTLKTVTTAAALGIAGKDYRFTTYLEYDGKIANGILSGNIYVRGTGDPTLGSDRFAGYCRFDTLIDNWATLIRQAGIKQITGSVIADALYLDEKCTPDGWEAGDIGNYYAPPITGLNFNENIYKIIFKPGKPKSRATIARTEPVVKNLVFVNNTIHAGYDAKDNCWIYGSHYAYRRLLRGAIPASMQEVTVKGSMPDPPQLMAELLSSALALKNVKVAGSPKTLRECSAETGKLPRTLLLNYNSPTLADIVLKTNTHSINLFAESLFLLCGTASYGGAPNEEKANSAIKMYWHNRGIDTLQAFIEDGSGLTNANSCSAEFLTSIMAVASKDTNIASVFKASLPVAGQSGTIKEFCKNGAASGNLKAKSGSVRHVICFAGYITTGNGKELAFSIMVNKYRGKYKEARAALEPLLNAIASSAVN